MLAAPPRQLHPRQLTTRLKAAHNVTALVALHETYSSDFNGIHIATFWSTLGRLAREQRTPAARKQLAAARRQTQQMLSTPEVLDDRSFASVAYGAARANVGSAEPWATL